MAEPRAIAVVTACSAPATAGWHPYPLDYISASLAPAARRAAASAGAPSVVISAPAPACHVRIGRAGVLATSAVMGGEQTTGLRYSDNGTGSLTSTPRAAVPRRLRRGARMRAETGRGPREGPPESRPRPRRRPRRQEPEKPPGEGREPGEVPGKPTDPLECRLRTPTLPSSRPHRKEKWAKVENKRDQEGR